MRTSPTVETAALTRVFSRGVVRELGETGQSPLLARLLQQSGIPDSLPADATLADAFDLAFSSLRRIGNRDDYVYRVAVTQRIALGRHNLRTATIVNELRARKSKADLVILNGTSTAYEIKSERDSFSRLAGQIADYRAVFASVYVVTSPMQACAALSITPNDVGVLVLSSRFRLQVERQAIDQPERVDPLSILDTLRVQEAIDVASDAGIDFPNVPNTQRWHVLREIFASLGSRTVHDATVRVLRTSRSRAELEPYLKELPLSLRAAALATDLSVTARQNLTAAAWLPLRTALAWS
ncbi:sce7726 family protein [Cryobacterium sp. Y50]|uniref:sce7726 family protein n=1 Tax=Cryobacterium sp. Y50 TaxID=2048286 RepID=UPI0011B091E0|nr:sce7726 family protein [Cryobacterium sp. Y50]